MQAELENWAIDWINEHCDLALSNPNPVRYLRDQFAELLKGKVLCDAEPVACMMVNRTHKIAPSLHWHPVNDWHITWEPVPLYAPASLSGNADMGKEGNE